MNIPLLLLNGAAVSLAIARIDSVGDGIHAQAVVDGVPLHGGVNFFVSRTPYLRDAKAAAYQSIPRSNSSLYVIAFDKPVLWYIWIVSSDGVSQIPVAVTIAYGADQANSYGAELGERLRQIIWDNKPGIESALKAYPKLLRAGGIRQVQYGFDGDVTHFPSIVVDEPITRTPYVATDYVRSWDFTFSIRVLCTRQDEVTAKPLAHKIQDALLRILGYTAYETLRLDSGAVVYFGQPVEGRVHEGAYGQAFEAQAYITWTGNLLIQDDPGVLLPL